MTEIHPVQHPLPLPKLEKVRVDEKKPRREQPRKNDKEERSKQTPNQHIDEYA